jgi:endonuclease III
VPGLSSVRAVARWIRMLVFPGGVVLSGLDQVPLVVDVDVRRATELLSLTAPGVPPAEARRQVAAVWAEALGAGAPVGPGALAGTALALDQVLLFHGRVGCGWCREHLTLEPIGPACDGCRLRG